MKEDLKKSLMILLFTFAGVGIFTFIEAMVLMSGYELTTTSCTESMKPYLSCMCPILVKKYTTIFDSNIVHQADYSEMKAKIIDDVEVGDVVVYQSNFGEKVIHRIISIGLDDGRLKDVCVTIKGDNNEVDDGCVLYGNILGKLVWKGC